MILLLKFYPYHFVRTILSVPFCPLPFCPRALLCSLIKFLKKQLFLYKKSKHSLYSTYFYLPNSLLISFQISRGNRRNERESSERTDNIISLLHDKISKSSSSVIPLYEDVR